MSKELSLKSLEPKWARFCLEIISFLEKDLQVELKDKSLLVAFSGGVDSTSLLGLAKILAKQKNCSLFAAHLNHQLRPEASHEAKEAAAVCEHLKIQLVAGSSKVKTYAQKMGLGLEEAGRTIRYRFLFALKKKLSANYILTGHHLNDLAEDFLHRQLRGSGWPALMGMQAWQEDLGILRPFLLTPKTKLKEFSRHLELGWQEDSSNQDQTFLRNRIRHRLLPLFFQENPNFLENVRQLWFQANLDRNYWERQIFGLRKQETKSKGQRILPAEALNLAHPALRLRWYKEALQKAGPGQVLANNLFNLDKCWQDRAWGKTVQFPGDKRAQVSPEGIRIFHKDSLKSKNSSKPKK